MYLKIRGMSVKAPHKKKCKAYFSLLWTSVGNLNVIII
jgi:hypothetical protein